MISSKFKYNLYISLFLGIFLLLNFGLSVTNSPLCKSQGCELAGSIINIDKSYLYLLGATFSLFLSFLVFKTVELKSLKSFSYFQFFITIAFIFESIMFISLIKLKSEICIVCLITYLSIILMFISSFKSNIVFRTVSILIPIVLAITILSFSSDSKIIKSEKDSLILFQSDSCSHCKNVKEYLNKENIIYEKREVDQSFLSALNIKTIPVLIENKNGKIIILEGEKNIISHFEANKFSLFSNTNTFNYKENDTDGCSLTKTSCND